MIYFFNKKITIRLIPFAFFAFFSFTINKVKAQVSYKSIVAMHDSLALPNHSFFNHTAQIEVIDSGEVLPNQIITSNKILIVSGVGGKIEGGADQDMWYTRSNDEGVNWDEPRSMCNLYDTIGAANVFNATLYKSSNNLLHQLYLWNQAPNGGSTGNYPIFLKKKVSMDGGISWIDSGFVKVIGIPDTTTFRLIGPFCKPIKTIDDSLFFPIYYRIVGSPNAYFAILKCDTLLTKFHLKLYPRISFEHPNRLIEPCAIKKGNVIKTYFRSGNGYICTVESKDDGSTWGEIKISSIKNPGTLITALSGSEGLLSSNLNSEIRGNLVLFKEDENGINYFEIDHLTEGMEQVSYPNMVEDKKGNIHIVYSGIGLDRLQGLRFGNIYYKVITSQNFNFCELPKDTFLHNFLTINKGFKRTKSGKVLFPKNNEIIYIDKNKNIGTYTLDTKYKIIDIEDYVGDTILLLTNFGILKYNFMNGSILIVNSNFKSGKIKLLSSNTKTVFNYNSKQLTKISLLNGSNECQLTLPSAELNQTINSIYANIVDIQVDKITQLIYLINDLGDIYTIDTTCNFQLLKLEENPGVFSAIHLFNDSLYSANKAGYIFVCDKFTGDKGRTMYNESSNNSYTTFITLNDALLGIGTNNVIIFQKNKVEQNFQFCGLSTIVSYISSDEDSIYLLDNLGLILSIPFKQKNTNISNDDLSNINKKELIIYPNPTNSNNSLNILSNMEVISIKMYDYVGNLINESMPLERNPSFFIKGGVDSGLYFFQIETKEGIFHKSFLIDNDF